MYTKNRLIKEFSKKDVVINLIFSSEYFARESVINGPLNNIVKFLVSLLHSCGVYVGLT